LEAAIQLPQHGAKTREENSMKSNYSVVLLACTFMSGLAIAGSTHAEDGYPSRQIRLIVPSLPGGNEDFVARKVATILSQRLGQPIVVENNTGADGAIGTTMIAQAKPDGYTIGIGTPGTLSTNKLLQPDLPYDPKTDFEAITMAIHTPEILVINPSLPVKTVAELISYAKAHPGELKVGNGGLGSSQFVASMLFQKLTGTKMVEVAYKSGAAPVPDLVAGRIQVFMTGPLALLPFIKSGQLRALGVGADERLTELPDVPTLKEAGVDGFDFSSWYGFVAPKGTPEDIVDKLNQNIVDILTKDPVKTDLNKIDDIIAADTPDHFHQMIEEEFKIDSAVLAKAPSEN
jgi:tripartite-type tricarboxylate transporter receptor subunit TctC